jgi:hypothetical protein
MRPHLSISEISFSYSFAQISDMMLATVFVVVGREVVASICSAEFQA